jgi:hypothetical protein
VRHPLVLGIVRAYEAYREANGAHAANGAQVVQDHVESAPLRRRRRAGGDPAAG